VKVFIRWLANFVVDHPVVATLALLGLTAVAGLGHAAPEWFERPSARNPDASARPAEPAADRPNIEPIQVSRGDVLLVAQTTDFFTPAAADAVRAAVAALEALPQV
jgi:hypothetical protein